MAPAAMILGGISGTVSALFGWLLFGLSFWGAVVVYFSVALGVMTLLVLVATLRRASPKKTERKGQANLQRA